MRRLAQTLGAPSEPSGAMRLATIEAVTGVTVSISFGGGTVLDGIPRLASYTPALGDTALVWVQGGQLVVLGALA